MAVYLTLPLPPTHQHHSDLLPDSNTSAVLCPLVCSSSFILCRCHGTKLSEIRCTDPDKGQGWVVGRGLPRNERHSVLTILRDASKNLQYPPSPKTPRKTIGRLTFNKVGAEVRGSVGEGVGGCGSCLHTRPRPPLQDTEAACDLLHADVSMLSRQQATACLQRPT